MPLLFFNGIKLVEIMAGNIASFHFTCDIANQETNREYTLPAGSEKHEVLQTGSTRVAILPCFRILYNNVS